MADSIADEIKKLGELRATGLLTDEEFTRQKDLLLSHDVKAPALHTPLVDGPRHSSTASERTNGFAIASLVLGLLVFGLPSLLAIVFGFIAYGQINRSEGRQKGKGLATAGIILGFLGVIGVIVFLGESFRDGGWLNNPSGQ